jgi:hypothetical protein
LNGNVPEKKLNLFQLATRGVAEPGTRPSKIVRREPLDPAVRAYCRTTCLTAFSVSPSPQAFPFLFTRRNSLPLVTLAA